jgi:hypothetical protein
LDRAWTNAPPTIVEDHVFIHRRMNRGSQFCASFRVSRRHLTLAEIDESVIAARRSMLLFRNDVIEHQRPIFRVDSRHLSRNNSPG